MKITVNKTNRNEPTVNVEFTKRGFELFVGLLGATSNLDKAQTINRSIVISNSGNLTDSQEVSEIFNYHEILKVLEYDVYPNILKVVEFVYDKGDLCAPKWRNVHVTNEDDSCIEGLEDGKTFKKFLKSRIVGGRILIVQK